MPSLRKILALALVLLISATSIETLAESGSQKHVHNVSPALIPDCKFLERVGLRRIEVFGCVVESHELGSTAVSGSFSTSDRLVIADTSLSFGWNEWSAGSNFIVAVYLAVDAGSWSTTLSFNGLNSAGSFGVGPGSARDNAGNSGNWSFTVSSGSTGNTGIHTALIAAKESTEHIVHRAKIVEERAHDPPRYSCFISFSSADKEFVTMLVADLRRHGIRCWFSDDCLRIGARTRREIDKAIRAHDKLLVVMSKNSIRSTWVEREVEMGFAEENIRGANVLFPIRLDDQISNVEDGWPGDIQRMRNVCDLSRWREKTEYQAALERILRDLVKV